MCRRSLAQIKAAELEICANDLHRIHYTVIFDQKRRLSIMILVILRRLESDLYAVTQVLEILGS